MTRTANLPKALQPIPNRSPKHDWPAVRHDYVIEGLSREEVIQKHEVPAKFFDMHAKKGGWLELKLDIETRLKKQLEGLPVIPDALLVAVDQQWRQRFRELEQMTVYIQRWLVAHDGQVGPHEINRLTQAQQNIVKMQRLLMGESTENVGLIDQAVEKVLGVIERYVPEEDRQRLRDDIARVFNPAGLLPAPR